MYDVRLLSVSAIIFAVIVYNQLARTTDHVLLSLIVMGGIGGILIYYIKGRSEENAKMQTNTIDKINADGRPSGRVETSFAGSKLLPETFPKKGFKYLPENSRFVDLASSLRVVKMFDKAKYSDLLVLLDRLQKIYMYILAGRYSAYSYIPSFMDTREQILENLYGLVFVLPRSFKHVYGLSPEKLMQDSITEFTQTSRMMIDILKSYAEKTAKLPHIPDVAETPSPTDAFDKTTHMRLP